MRASSCASCARRCACCFVQLTQQIELLPLFVRRNELVLDVLDQLFDFLVLSVDVGALVNSRQKCALPVLRFLDRITAGAHRDESGQILVHGAEAVSHPRTHARARQPRIAAIHQQQRRLVIRHIRVHRANHRDVVDVLGDVRKQFAHLDAALAVLLELERRLKRRAGVALGLQIVHRQRLAVQFGQRRLRIERIHVRRSAIREDVNDALGLGRKVRRFRSERRVPLMEAPPSAANACGPTDLPGRPCRNQLRRASENRAG